MRATANMRLRQEILLGIAAMRALTVMGIEPSVCHMNEGHSAFMAVERLRQVMERHQLTRAEAREVVWATNVFTTPHAGARRKRAVQRGTPHPVSGRLHPGHRH